MNFIENAWAVVVKSYAVWLGWLLGFLGSYMGFLNSGLLSDADKLAWHVQGQLHFIPIFIGFVGLFGIPAARALNQNLQK